MAPRRPRGVKSGKSANQTSANHPSDASERSSIAFATNNLVQVSDERTFNTTDPTSAPTPAPSSTTEPRPNKRSRNDGPAHGRPMQLRSMSGGSSGIEHTGSGSDSRQANVHPVALQRPAALQRTSLFAPAPHPSPIPLWPAPSRSNEENNNLDSNDSGVETEPEELNEAQLTELAQRFPSNSNVPEAVAIERPLWLDSSVAASASASLDMSRSSSVANAPAEQEQVDGGGGDAAGPSLPLAVAMWPSDIDLVFIPGTNRLTLTIQCPPVRAIIHDTFENVRAYLLFDHSFPDAVSIPTTLKRCLVSAAAESHNPRAPDIHRRLIQDDKYMERLSRLPRARIPIYRSEIKERCAAIIQIAFLSIGDMPTISGVVSRQLSRYNYTFPTSNANHLHMVSNRSKPYRNARIIAVIRDLCFIGGSNSFAHRFRSRFPTFQHNDGRVVREVPVVMVALVATGLYASIYEWRTGGHQPTDFSANAYLDVYNGHIETFRHIRENRNAAFHNMMGDIYAQASSDVASEGVPIAELDLDELDN